MLTLNQKLPSKEDIDEEFEILTKYTADAFVDNNEY